MSIFELAKKYYPRLWGSERIEALVDAGRLTREQADEVMGAASKLDAAGETRLEG